MDEFTQFFGGKAVEIGEMFFGNAFSQEIGGGEHVAAAVRRERSGGYHRRTGVDREFKANECAAVEIGFGADGIAGWRKRRLRELSEAGSDFFGVEHVLMVNVIGKIANRQRDAFTIQA